MSRPVLAVVSLVSASVLFGGGSAARADDDCGCAVALVKDKLKVNADSRLQQAIFTLITEETYQKLKAGGSLEAFGIPIGGSYEEFKRNYYQKYEQISIDESHSLQLVSEHSSPEAYRAWSECMERCIGRFGFFIRKSKIEKTVISFVLVAQPTGDERQDFIVEGNPVLVDGEWANGEPRIKDGDRLYGEIPLVFKRDPTRTFVFTVKAGKHAVTYLAPADAPPPPTPTFRIEFYSDGGFGGRKVVIDTGIDYRLNNLADVGLKDDLTGLKFYGPPGYVLELYAAPGCQDGFKLWEFNTGAEIQQLGDYPTPGRIRYLWKRYQEHCNDKTTSIRIIKKG